MHSGQKSLNGFKAGTVIGRFRSDGAASMAVEGLRPTYQAKADLNYAALVMGSFA